MYGFNKIYDGTEQKTLRQRGRLREKDWESLSIGAVERNTNRFRPEGMKFTAD